jgi:hypothetical protein
MGTASFNATIRRALALALLAAPILAASPDSTWAQDAAPNPSIIPQTRPIIMTNRWEENWVALSNPKLRTQPFDSLKYIPLLPNDPYSYLSFGLTIRERFEDNDAVNFGIGHIPDQAYLLQRVQAHADLHLNENWEVFAQLEDDRAYGKKYLTSADQDQLDLRLLFLAYTTTFSNGSTLKARIGRQDFLFDLQRFVSSRDGPNVRQSFDAIWADWETGRWRLIGFMSEPVQYYNDRTFDDHASTHFRFDTLRVEHLVLGNNELSAYYSLYQRSNASYLFAKGNENRQIFDIRFAGTHQAVDWDLEAMFQAGSVGPKTIRAWAVGTRTGYTFHNAMWQPRIGLQLDAASGDTHPGSHVLGTFNPLFPNGYYFTLAGYTGYTNLIHVKTSLTVKPAKNLAVTGALGFLWRETTADAIYVQPNVPLAGTAGHGGGYTGAYAQFRVDYVFTPNLTGAIEAVHYQVGNAIRHAGGHNSDYLGTELKFSW